MDELIKREVKVAIITTVLIVLFSFSIWILPNFGNLINPEGPFWSQAEGPHDYTEKEIFNDPNLNGNVIVYRDHYGVPHIYADDYRDLFYVYGYLQAQDRIFEMTLLKLVGYGRLSEVAGGLAVGIDKYMRTISLWKSAEDLIQVAEENKDTYNRAYTMMEQFTAGVNKWVGENRFNMPVEFALLDLPVEEWSMLDSGVMANLAGLMLSWMTEDLTMEQLRLTIGPFLKQNYAKYGVTLDDLYPTWNMSYPYETPIIPDAHSIFPSADETEDHGIYTPKLLKTISALSRLDQTLVDNVKNEYIRMFLEIFFHRFDLGIGSNNWVINGDLSATGMPILNGDPHLMLMAPSVWYEAHLVCLDDEYEELENPHEPGTKVKFKKNYNVYGVSFPGTPVILIGHNEHCAWSETNVGTDAGVDFYVETLSEDGKKYKYMGEWHDVEVINKPILVKAGPIKYYEPFSIRYTRHGPILSDVLIDVPYFGGNIPGDYEHVSVKYIGYNNSAMYNQLVAFDLVNRAENVYELKTALDFYPNPPQNFVVADDSGNIGMISAGLFPLRGKYSDTETWNGKWVVKATYDGRYLQPGDGTGQEWVGFVPPEHLPHCINPVDQDYLASANQRTIASSIYNYSIGDSWSPGWRARSINRYLDTTDPESPYYGKKISMNDMKDIQYSDYDIAARDYVPVILDTYDALSEADKEEFSTDFKKAIVELRAWKNHDSFQYHT